MIQKWLREHPAAASEASVSLLILLWRVLTVAPAQWVEDWLLILAGYWLFAILVPRNRLWHVVTAGVSSYLLLIYGRGYLPHLIWVLTT